MDSLKDQLTRDGFTDVVEVLPPEHLADIQELIYEQTKSFLEPHDHDLGLVERLKVPFVDSITRPEWLKLMQTVNESDAFAKCIREPSVKSVFRDALGEDAELFPISFFRARIPGLASASYGWHQDAGTWYITKHRDLAPKCPATLWTSVNGADTSNSIELLRGSHLAGLGYHLNVEGQGRFSLKEQPRDSSDVTRVSCTPGQGVMFTHLTMHRSVPTKNPAPRYSIDIRYFAASCAEKFRASLPFVVRRELARWF